MLRLTKIFTLTSILALFVSGFTPLQQAQAVSGGGWKAGNIIDDSLFFRASDLSSNDIQSFLNSKVPNCDTWGTQPYGGTTRASYAASKGYSTPFTCLKDFSMNTQGKPGDSYCAPIASGSKSAATIINEISNACGISAKALIVMLEKEQGLVSDDWPWSIQYRGAMGYGCPDTAPCDAEYYGFFNQVYNAARQFKVYAANQSSYRYKPYQTNFVYWHPSLGGCGGTDVLIQNKATAGLYNYTPYQPNQAALNNLYGSGDSCSSYGNRNFWRLFNDWFDTTYAGPYQARIIQQSSNPSIKPGRVGSVYVRFQNIGTDIWFDDIASQYEPGRRPVRLATDLGLNRCSAFIANWQYCNRPAINFNRVYDREGNLSPDQHQALPGESVEFWFAYHVPHGTQARNYLEGFRPVVEGWGPMNDTGTYFNITVPDVQYSAQYIDQSAIATLKQGQSTNAYVRYRNSGNNAWYDNTSSPGSYELPTHLATDYPLNRVSAFGAEWPHPHRAATVFGAVYESDGVSLAANQHIVQPGQIVRFNLKIKVDPQLSPGFYRESIRPVVQGIGPMNDTGTWLGINVERANYTAQYVSQSSTINLQRGSTSANAYIRYRNIGNIAWYDNTNFSSNSSYPTHLATDYPLNRVSAFGAEWPHPHRAATVFGAVYESDGVSLAANQHIVQPGQIAEFRFSVKASTSAQVGLNKEALRPVVQGIGPMNDTGTWLGINVQ